MSSFDEQQHDQHVRNNSSTSSAGSMPISSSPLSWIKQRAIVWDETSARKEQEPNCCYWDPQIVQLLQQNPWNYSTVDDCALSQSHDRHEEIDSNTKLNSLSINDDDNDDSLHNDNPIALSQSSDFIAKNNCISYQSLFLWTAMITKRIRTIYFIKYEQSQMVDEKSSNNLSNGLLVKEDIHNNNSQYGDAIPIPIGVAIPEGPLLPLAILVVHALNYVTSLLQEQTSFSDVKKLHYAVLIPIEPNDPFERNLHVMQDSKPHLILSVPGKDMDKIQEIISTIQNQNITDDKVCTATEIHLIDFISLLNDVKEEMITMAHRDIYDRLEQQMTQWTDYQHDLSMQETISHLCQTLSLSEGDYRQFGKHDTTDVSSTMSKQKQRNKISHVVYTSGSTGRPKGCISSTSSLLHYVNAKNQAHGISHKSTVMLASSLSFDPCLSDIIATFHAKATLAIAPRSSILSNLMLALQRLHVTHILCTPTLWNMTLLTNHHNHSFEKHTAKLKKSLPHLQCIALGGEPISKRIVQVWARSKDKNLCDDSCRLLATYGVTEACVYQTCGEVFFDDDFQAGQYVGQPLQGMNIRICKEDIQDKLVNVGQIGMAGEVVLYGEQIDEHTNYLNRKDLSYKFATESIVEGDNTTIRYYYRTGDRGCLNPNDNSLTILGRIVGEEGMIKINGVRVELGEIENAIIDPVADNTGIVPPVVIDCLARVISHENSQPKIYAYCAFSDTVWNELDASACDLNREKGFIIGNGPIFTLLHSRCNKLLKAACIPSAFVAIAQVPMSPTGKRDRSNLPNLDECCAINGDNGDSVLLKDYGVSGALVAKTIVEFLNLQRYQESMLTTSVSFVTIGGDSLSAAIVSRTLYAHHLQVDNSRFLGDEYGQLPGVFNAGKLLCAKNMGEYVDLLDERNVFVPALAARDGAVVANEDTIYTETVSTVNAQRDNNEQAILYEALLQATTMGQTSIAICLLNLGADPDYGVHDGRIGKTSGRIEQRAIFKSSPLHLASLKGDVALVETLLNENANYKSPNTNGLFPIHLAASGLDGDESSPEEAERRLECIKLLLDAGCAFLIRDANKQSILHAAARAGHGAIVEYCIDEYSARCQKHEDSGKSSITLAQFINWFDRWSRTPVHWAVLNGRLEALKVLLDKGCDPAPYKAKTNKHSSMIMETPMEICERMYKGTVKGEEMKRLLEQALDRIKET